MSLEKPRNIADFTRLIETEEGLLDYDQIAGKLREDEDLFASYSSLGSQTIVHLPDQKSLRNLEEEIKENSLAKESLRFIALKDID